MVGERSSSASAVALESDKTLPSWFKPARFLHADFDAEAYVSDLRRFVSNSLLALERAAMPTCTDFCLDPEFCVTSRSLVQVPLETLSSQLQTYLTVLKGKLVEVINEDYNDFVSLSTKLVNVDGAVTQMQRPLLALKVRAASALC